GERAAFEADGEQRAEAPEHGEGDEALPARRVHAPKIPGDDAVKEDSAGSTEEADKKQQAIERCRPRPGLERGGFGGGGGARAWLARAEGGGSTHRMGIERDEPRAHAAAA